MKSHGNALGHALTVGYDAHAVVGEVIEHDAEWWGVCRTERKTADDTGWEWLREYADNVYAQKQWVYENIHNANWSTAAMNDAWQLAQSGKDAQWTDRATVAGVEVWHVTFAVKTYHDTSVDCVAKGVARFVKLARRAGINARYF